MQEPAREGRKLADQTGQSAEKVSELIGQVQADSHKAAVAMREGTKVVQQGMDQANGRAIAEVNRKIQSVNVEWLLLPKYEAPNSIEY